MLTFTRMPPDAVGACAQQASQANLLNVRLPRISSCLKSTHRCRLGHVQRHPDDRLVKQMLHANAAGRRSMGSPSCLAHTDHERSADPQPILMPAQALTSSSGCQGYA